MAPTDKWDDVEAAFAELERYGALRPTIAVMRRVIARLKQAGLPDLQPSHSHASLVFRRSSRRGVLVHWSEVEGLKVSHLAPGFAIVDTRTVAEDELIDVLREYLDGPTS